MNCKCKKVMVVIPGSVDLYRCDVWQEIFDKMPVIKEISLDTEVQAVVQIGSDDVVCICGKVGTELICQRKGEEPQNFSPRWLMGTEKGETNWKKVYIGGFNSIREMFDIIDEAVECKRPFIAEAGEVQYVLPLMGSIHNIVEAVQKMDIFEPSKLDIMWSKAKAVVKSDSMAFVIAGAHMVGGVKEPFGLIVGSGLGTKMVWQITDVVDFESDAIEILTKDLDSVYMEVASAKNEYAKSALISSARRNGIKLNGNEATGLIEAASALGFMLEFDGNKFIVSSCIGLRGLELGMRDLILLLCSRADKISCHGNILNELYYREVLSK